MRPHVELIQEKDLVWHEAELHKGSGRARQRNLSYDEENGAASTRVVFDKAWSRAGGYHHADVEWYVQTGEGRDKAGAYGIQGLASLFINRIEGDYFNVVGLPLARLRQLIVEATR